MNIPQHYRIRSGTTDEGKDYEIGISILIMLKCMSIKNKIKDSWIACNVDECGALDDVVLTIKSAEGNTIVYLIQLKHSQNVKELKNEDFKRFKKSDSNPFYINKYVESISDIKRKAYQTDGTKYFEDNPMFNFIIKQCDNIVFIIFTNNKISKKCTFLRNVNKNSKLDIENMLYKLIDTGGQISTFQVEELNVDVEEDLKKTLKNKFFFFSRQQSAKKLNSQIKKYISILFERANLLENAKNDIIRKVLTFFNDWSKGYIGGYYPINQDLMYRLLGEIVLTPFFKNVDLNYDYSSNSLWKEVIDKINVTIVEEDETVNNFFEQYIKEEINSNKEVSYEIEVIQKTMLRRIEKSELENLNTMYELLWKMERVPLLLTVTHTEEASRVLQLIKSLKYTIKVIILTTCGINFSETEKIESKFCRLANLSSKKLKQILTLTVSLQARSNVMVKKFKDYEILKFFTVKDFIYMLLKKFVIGNTTTALPNNFVTRRLIKICLNNKILLSKQELFLIKCNSVDSFQNYLKVNKLNLKFSSWNERDNPSCYKVILCDERIAWEEIQKFCSPQRTATHVLCFHENSLQWLRTYGEISKLEENRENEKVAFEDNFEFLTTNNKFIISGPPGIGKSVLLDYIALEAPSSWWIVKINLSENLDYFKTEEFTNDQQNALTHLCHFLKCTESKEHCNLTTKLLSEYFYAKQICDSYDEIPPEYHKKVKSFLHGVEASSNTFIIATRSILQYDLEKEFNLLSYNLLEFSKNQQVEVLQKYFLRELNVQDENKKKVVVSFTKILLDFVTTNMYNYNKDEDFCSNPLHLYLVSEVFLEDCDTYYEKRVFNSENLNLLDLYERFIQKKNKIACEKFSEHIASDITLYTNFRAFFALKILFPREILDELKIEEKLQFLLEMSPNILQAIQRDGITIVQNDPHKVTFVHRTFAEYITAHWMADNFKRLSIKNLFLQCFQENFKNVRKFFDLMLTRKCSLLTAIINDSIHEPWSQQLIENVDVFKEFDEANRSALHLISSWGGSSSKYVRLMKLNCEFSNNQDVLGFLPIEYALMTESYEIANEICTIPPNTDIKVLLNFDVPSLYNKIFRQKLFFLSFCCQKFLFVEFVNEIKNYIKNYVNTNLFVTTNDFTPNLSIMYGMTRLHISTFLNSQNQTQTLVEIGENPNLPDEHHMCVLHWAVINKKTEIVRYLSDRVNINSVDTEGNSALHYAVMLGNDEGNDILEIICSLLKKNANLCLRNNRKQTPINLAILSQQENILITILHNTSEEMLTQCLKEDIVFSFITINHLTRILNIMTKHLILRNKHKEIIKLSNLTIFQWLNSTYNIEANIKTLFITGIEIISHKTNTLRITQNQPSPSYTKEYLDNLISASYQDLHNLVDFLLKNRIRSSDFLHDIISSNTEFQEDSTSKYCFAALRGNLEKVDEHLTNRSSNRERNTNQDILKYAVIGGNLKIVDIILRTYPEELFRQDAKGWSALHWSSWLGYEDITKLLILKRSSIDLKAKDGETPLMLAALSGNPTTVKLLLKENANSQEKDVENNNSLHYAVVGKNADTVRLLLNIIDPNIPNIRNESALMFAALKGQSDAINALLAAKANIEAQDIDGKTALIHAVIGGHLNVIKIILENGGQIKTTDNNGATPAHWAVEKHFLNCIYLFNENINVRNIYGETPLFFAMHKRDLELMEKLDCAGANFEIQDIDGKTVLHRAAILNFLEELTFFVDKQCNLEMKDNFGNTPLLYGSFKGHEEIVRTLINSGAKLTTQNNKDMTAIEVSLIKGHRNISDIFLQTTKTIKHIESNLPKSNIEFMEKSCSIKTNYSKNQNISFLANIVPELEITNRYGLTPLHTAAFYGNETLVKILLDSGANINSRDDVGMTPLLWAIDGDHKCATNLLLKRGAAINNTNYQGETALIFAAHKNNVELVQALCTLKANLKMRDVQGRTILHHAVEQNALDVVQFLINENFDLEVSDNLGRTPLLSASYLDHCEILKLLLEAGASTDTKDEFGMTCLGIAMKEDNHEIVALLQKSANKQFE